MKEQNDVKEVDTSDKDYYQVSEGVWGMKIVFVNIFMISEGDEWVLVDAGLPGSADKIINMAEELFGKGAKPSAIILTHGHFDHVGAIEDLLKVWDVPVHAHPLELPYLTGKSSYPPPDPTVGGGMMSLSSPLYPTGPINISKNVQDISTDGTIPHLPGWRYIVTPGHSPGHISFFRISDGTLIVGDAFVTTKQESAIYALAQIKKLTGPPMYFTPDWVAAGESVRKLASLKPKAAATGHGVPMYGKELEESLDHLVNHFKEEAVPSTGRYVNEPARADKEGVKYVPPGKFPVMSVVVAVVIILVIIAALYFIFI